MTLKQNWQASQSNKNIFDKSVFSLKRFTLNLKTAYKLTTIGLLIAVAGISGCNSSTNAQSSKSNEWTGEWQFKDPYGSGQSIKIVLNPEGKVYVLPPVPISGENVAYEIPLEKVSENTSLPADTKVVKLEDMMKGQANKARQSEGKSYVGSMNRAQQAYLLENSKFATSIKELQLGIKSETDNYVYKIVPQSVPERVMNIAQAKREGINSYVGLVYITKVGNDNITISKLCETSQSLSKPPEMPKLAKDTSKSADIKCPSGFKSLG